MRGTVKWFNAEKRYGFITGEDGKDVFVHAKAVDEGIDLCDGVSVQMEVEKGPKGLRARTVSLLGAMLLMLMGCLAMLPGCSDLQARGPMKAMIDAQAQAAGEIKPQAVAGTLSLDTCLVKIGENAVIFNQYDAAKTLNWFEYAFGKKTIWVNPTYSELLGRTAAAADLAVSQATTKPASWCNATVAAECAILIRVKQAKDGEKD